MQGNENTSSPWNSSEYLDYKDLASFKTMRSMVLYLGPFLMLVGTTGNVLAAIVVTKSQFLWQKTTSVYILVLAIVDTICLDYGMLEFILHLCDVQVQKYLTCKFKWFIIYFLPMLEAWVLVNMSLERFTSVFFPFQKAHYFKKHKALTGLLITLVGCFGLNAIYLVIIHTNQMPEGTYCDTNINHTTLLQIWGWLDVTCTSVLPFLIMFVTSLAIIIKIVVTNIQKHRMKVGSWHRISRTTVMLLAICVLYLTFTAPVAILWPLHSQYYEEMLTGTKSVKQVTDTLITAYYVNLFWYFNYVVNFYIYCISNPRFRVEVVRLIKLKLTNPLSRDTSHCHHLNEDPLATHKV